MAYKIGYWNPDSCVPKYPTGYPRPCLSWSVYSRMLDYLRIDSTKSVFIGYRDLGTVQHFGINNTHDQETMKYDNESLFGAMANYEIDVALQIVTAKESRLQFFSFGLPFRFDRFCMFLRKPTTRTPIDSPWYFINLFSTELWFAALATLTACCLLRIISRSTVRADNEVRANKLDNFIRYMISLRIGIYVPFLTFGALCYIYNSCMCANFVKSGRPLTLIRTIDDAIVKMREGSFRLTLDIYALELIRIFGHHELKNDFTDLAEVFQHNPPRVIERTGCPSDDQAFGTNDLYLETEKNVSLYCDMDAIQKLYRVCFSGYPLFIGLMFKRDSHLVERNNRAVQFLPAHDHRILQRYVVSQKLSTLQDALVVQSDIRQMYPVLKLKSHALMITLIWVSGLFISLSIFFAEIYWFIRHFLVY